MLQVIGRTLSSLHWTRQSVKRLDINHDCRNIRSLVNSRLSKSQKWGVGGGGVDCRCSPRSAHRQSGQTPLRVPSELGVAFEPWCCITRHVYQNHGEYLSTDFQQDWNIRAFAGSHSWNSLQSAFPWRKGLRRSNAGWIVGYPQGDAAGSSVSAAAQRACLNRKRR